jgi:predicted heme/steroid binding protein
MKSHLKRTALIMTMLLILLMAMGCSSEEPQVETEEPMVSEPDLPTFTLEELAEFDGKDGARAYVAVQGVVYDVTDLPRWEGGTHNGYDAGQDLTDIILNKSPHGLSTLERATKVGLLE